MRPRCNIINQTPCCPSPILITSSYLAKALRKPEVGHLGASTSLWSSWRRSQVLFCLAPVPLPLEELDGEIGQQVAEMSG